MAEEYSYNDIIRMQEQAADSMREMQKNSRFRESPSGENEKEENRFSENFRNMGNDKNTENNFNVNQAFRERKSPSSFSGGLDEDKCLVLALIILLSKNCNDKLLLFALLYIIM